MIPVRLKLRNFMPYRESALDFTGIHLACITGDNGNGKSAIIDAITWALWGKARAASDDDLIHASQTEMEVEFEFNVGGQIYRIIRKRTRPKKRSGAGQSVLEFQIKNGEAFRPITGNTMGETQEKILEVLHMDYDTFINSAYLRQGHADEFTRQTPVKRKEVLGNILGLGIYDGLEEKAKEKAKAFEADNALLENSITEITGELARQPEFTAELERAEASLAVADRQTQEKEAALNLLRQKKDNLERIKAQLDEMETSIASKTGDLHRWEEQFAQHRVNIKKYEQILDRKAEIESGYTRYTAVKKSADDMDRQFRQTVGLDKQKSKLEQLIDKLKNELTTEHTVVRREIARLESQFKTLPDLKNQLTQTQTRSGKMGESEALLRQKEQSTHEAQSILSRLEAECPRLEKEIAEAEEKLNLIATHIASHTEAKCPLCEQELTREGLDLITAKYTREKQEKLGLLNRNRIEITQQRVEYAALQKEKTQLDSRLNEEKARAQSQEEVIRHKINEVEESAPKAAELKKAADDIEQRLAGRDFANEEQRVLRAIEAEMAAIGYDAARHEQVRQQLNQLEPFQRDKNSLDEATRLIEQEKALAAKAEESAHSLQESLQQDTVKKDALTAAFTGLPQARQELSAAEVEYKSISGQRSQAQEAVGSVRARLKRLAELDIKKKEYENRIAQSAREESIYRELAKAFGKNGIQALIIDAALPEIAEEANRLLARLTDSRMTVKFESQRTTKKDIMKETLDITIADELGTRNYEMFSGGEAFRINFAIRIALSRLLARRAGTPLPTLIIDEGFGTQDNTGMEKLKEAINSIQDDFEKILVITHMDDLKDAFPTRIDVTKTPDGSKITVN